MLLKIVCKNGSVYIRENSSKELSQSEDNSRYSSSVQMAAADYNLYSAVVETAANNLRAAVAAMTVTRTRKIFVEAMAGSNCGFVEAMGMVENSETVGETVMAGNNYEIVAVTVMVESNYAIVEAMGKAESNY